MNSDKLRRLTVGGFLIAAALFVPSLCAQVVLDGADETEGAIGAPTIIPNIDALQEYQLVTNSYDVEQGLVGGAVQLMTAKSGTDKTQGSAYVASAQTDLALNQTTYDSSAATGFPSSAAVDGSLGTAWMSATVPTPSNYQYLAVALPAQANIAAVTQTFLNYDTWTYVVYGTNDWTHYTVLVDHSAGVTGKTFSDVVTNSGPWQNISMVVTGSANNNLASSAEFDIFGGADMALSYTSVYDSSAAAGYPGTAAFDNNASTAWQASASNDQYLAVVLPSPTKVAAVSQTFLKSDTWYYVVYGTNDWVNYAVLVDHSGGKYATANVPVTDVVATPGAYQYIDLYITGSASGYDPSSVEFDIYGAASTGTNYYIDCSLRSNGNGLSYSNAWNSFTSPNAHTFQHGDVIDIIPNSTTNCSGTLNPQGSGNPADPIVITSYGPTTSPATATIDGGSNTAVLSLTNQSYWEIYNLELLNGYKYGLLVQAQGNTAISDIDVERVTATGADYRTVSTYQLDSGEIYISTCYPSQCTDSSTISGVTINHANVSDSTTNAGIYVNGSAESKGNNIVVENSTVSDVYGHGIYIPDAANVTISNNNVSYSGQCPTSECSNVYSGTVGIWVWNTQNTTIASNESSYNNTPATDGGGFDIDNNNQSVTLEYNYAHDNIGYCASVFSYDGSHPTVNSVIRYNVCANNQADANGQVTGDFFLHTWDGGTLNGVQIYNNTLFFDGTGHGTAALHDDATYSGSNPNFFANNIIDTPWQESLVITAPPMVLSNNLYWLSGATPYWDYNGTWYTSLSSYQSAVESNAQLADPDLNSVSYHGSTWPTTQFTPQSGSPAINAGTNVCAPYCGMGAVDFLGNSNVSGSNYNIGSFE